MWGRMPVWGRRGGAPPGWGRRDAGVREGAAAEEETGVEEGEVRAGVASCEQLRRVCRRAA